MSGLRPALPVLPATLAALAVACAGPAPAVRTTAEVPPNVILVVLDTVRADHLGLYGYARETSPFLNALGRGSVVFGNAVSSSSWTAPATASLMTGAYPARHGVTSGWHAQHRARGRPGAGNGAKLRIRPIASTLPTLAERLAARGYATFGVASNINIGTEMGFDRGFERFELHGRASAEELLRGVLLSWSDEIRRRSPWFVYIHLNDAHGPYTPRAPWYEPAEDEHDDVRARYDSEIRYVDEELRGALGALDPEDRAVVVVVTDHGEEFWERGRLGHFLSLHRELNQIALLVRAPGAVPHRVTARVGIIDVAPTLVALVDGAAGRSPDEPFPDGRSLLPLLRQEGAAAEDERTLFAHRVGFRNPSLQLWAAMRGPFKLILGDAGASLFDVDADPDERSDIRAGHPDVAAALADEIARSRAIPPPADEAIDVPFDEDRLEQLRSLGYVQ